MCLQFCTVYNFIEFWCGKILCLRISLLHFLYILLVGMLFMQCVHGAKFCMSAITHTLVLALSYKLPLRGSLHRG